MDSKPTHQDTNHPGVQVLKVKAKVEQISFLTLIFFVQENFLLLRTLAQALFETGQEANFVSLCHSSVTVRILCF